MDRCHQRTNSSGSESPPGLAAPAWCGQPIVGSDDGMFKAYGLVYRLMQHGIPVYWVVNPTKKPAALTQYEALASQTYIAEDVDMWILGGGALAPPSAATALTACPSATCAQPVARLNSGTLAPIANSYGYKEFPLRGGVFVIAPEDRARFDNFWKKTGEFSGLGAKYAFTEVDLYEVDAAAFIGYQNFSGAAPYPFTANATPIGARIDYDPPRIARLGSTSAVATSWLARAGLDDPASTASCVSGTFVPADAVYCNVSEAQIQAGALVSGAFAWAWIDKWSDNSPCATTAEKAMFAKISEFLTAVPGVRAGGHVMFMEGAVTVAENCLTYEPLGVTSVGLTTDNGAVNETATEPFIIRYPANLFAQWGDMPTQFQSGSTTRWTYYGAGATGYKPAYMGAGSTLVRLVTVDRAAGTNTLCSQHRSTPTCDVFANNADADLMDLAAYARFGNNPINGVVFYHGGNQIQNMSSHLRMVMNSLIALPIGIVPQDPAADTIEVSRSSPIVASIAGQQAQVSGTYEVILPSPSPTVINTAADAAGFRFPFVQGHLRAVPLTSITTTATAFDALASPLFDAADGIPAPNFSAGCGTTAFSGNCRTVFTNVATGANPARVMVSQTQVATIGPLTGLTTTALQTTLLQRVLAGIETASGFVPKLGGIDRSTVAVIEASPFAGSPVRPTIAYVGAADGMLHAICAQVAGPCTALGKELWAFIPRTQLPLLRFNTARINGSPAVADVFDDFTGSGVKQWRTILTFQTGSGDAGIPGRTPAVYALDITNPTDPKIIWEYATPDVRGQSELGQGLHLSMGPVRIGGQLRNMVFAQTNNGGIGGAGTGVYAIETKNGQVAWRWEHIYPAPRDIDNPPVPTTGIPGGVAGADLAADGSITDLAVTTLYGDVWRLKAPTGESFYPGPLYRFAEDFRPIGAPPTVYSDNGIMHVAIVSGGYADPINSSWAPDGVTQYSLGITFDAAVGLTPIAGLTTGGSISYSIPLGVGERGFSQITAIGGELFIATDNADINNNVNSDTYGTTGTDTGRIYRVNFVTDAVIGSPVVVAGGAGSIAAAGGNAYVASADAAQKLTGTPYAGGGVSVEVSSKEHISRSLWLRTE